MIVDQSYITMILFVTPKGGQGEGSVLDPRL